MLPAETIRRRFTAEEYRKMSEAGILHEDDRVELIRGEIVEMNPIGTRHLRRDEEDLKRLHEAVDQMRSSGNLWQFRRADSAFHLAVAGAAKNLLLSKAVEDGRAAMFLPLEPLEYEISVVELLEVHPKILDAIEEKDAGKAGDLMTDHLKTTRRRLAAVLKLGETSQVARVP